MKRYSIVCSCTLFFLLMSGMASALPQNACTEAGNSCYYALKINAGAAHKDLHYYSSLSPATEKVAAKAKDQVTHAIIVIHGYSRGANVTFDAVLQDVKKAGALQNTVVIAPLFQVSHKEAKKCHSRGIPSALPNDLLWTCSSWEEGGTAANLKVTSFQALDALINDLSRTWPRLNTITIAGFSAGAQITQRYISFASPDTHRNIHIRYVVADPSSWLYFDPVRPVPMKSGHPISWVACMNGSQLSKNCQLVFKIPSTHCKQYNQWKYGLANLSTFSSLKPEQLKARYRAADITYLEGELDANDQKIAMPNRLDSRCPAELQGNYRLQRGLAFVQYANQFLHPKKNTHLIIVPNCGHQMKCVWGSKQGADALILH